MAQVELKSGRVGPCREGDDQVVDVEAQAGGHAVAAQIEFESKICKRSVMFQF